jgi:hypothetical protein
MLVRRGLLTCKNPQKMRTVRPPPSALVTPSTTPRTGPISLSPGFTRKEIHMSIAAVITWVVTVLAGFFLLSIWIIEYDREFQSAAATRLPCR